MLKLIRMPTTKALPLQGVLTIGNFDGVHLGHQALIQAVINQAKKLKAPAMVMTFEPHPAEFFTKSHATIARLTKWREKWVALTKQDINFVITLKFNKMIAELSAVDFIEKILYQALHIKALIVGDDFHFGKGREGDIALLRRLSNDYHFTVTTIPAVKKDNQRVSSTLIREALYRGSQSLAQNLLGRPYSMIGHITHGKKLGRKLGFPTINIAVNRQVSPIQGVYIVYVKGILATMLPGVANIGTRPAVSGQYTLLEVHLLNFHQEIYGLLVEVIFIEKIRDEAYFSTLLALKKEIENDICKARQYFQLN